MKATATNIVYLTYTQAVKQLRAGDRLNRGFGGSAFFETCGHCVKTSVVAKLLSTGVIGRPASEFDSYYPTR